MKRRITLLPLLCLAAALALLLCLPAPKAAAATVVDGGICGSNGNNLTWTLDSDGLLAITGQGDMADWDLRGAPWYAQRDKVKTLAIGSGVTSIGDHAFSYCISLTSVTFAGPAPATIGESAFSGVTATVYYPANDPSWTEEVRQNYGGTLTWEAPGEPKPAITAQPQNATASLGSTATFTVTASGTGLSYQWQYMRPGETTWRDAQVNATTATFRQNNVEPRHNGFKFRCKITNSAGTVYSDAVTLTVG